MKQLKIVKQITIRESQSLIKYFQEIGKVEMITPEEEVELARRIREGDRAALEKLTKANLRFVVTVAKQYQSDGLALGDLISEGNLGLIKAAERFDETRGFKFISYAVWWIRQSIIQALAEKSRVVRLPVNKLSSLNKISRKFSELEQVYQRDPTVDEMAEALKIVEKEVEINMRLSNKRISVDAPFINSDGNSLLDVMEDEQIDPTDSRLLQDSLISEIQEALSKLTPRESEVISSYYGLNNHKSMTLEEIGDKFGLTRERVRQIKEKATKRLRHNSVSDALKSYLG
ncbi:MAG: RNA polymerase sigma factor RpoD/SigA [Cytophagales bacterium]|nr:RNA polymerase sigma factor RpoD/SigA [Cytophagales bacterium]